MKLQQVLNDYAFPPEYIKAIMSSGILDLYEPQADAINKGVLDGENLLMSVPTAAGKTLIAELSILKSLMNKPGLCLYMAPLKALASEKYKDFKKKYEPLGYKVVLAVGDQNASYQTLQDVDILVATAEKVDSLLRFKAQWLLDSLRVVIIDEIHFINDGSRGPTLEILAARMMQLCSDVQIIALSATVQNAQDMAKWLNARCVLSTWRPIPLKEGVYFHGKIKFNGHGTRLIDRTVRDEISNITLDTLRDNGQVLIFVNSRRSAQAVSRQVSAAVAKVLTDEEKEKLALLAKKIAGNQLDLTKIGTKLAEAIRHGAAFHHAGLKPQHRELIEENFKRNLIKVISCTPTLAAGVNLPARRAIIRDCKRFEAGRGSTFIPTSEYKQCAGRAGRPQFDSYGEAVLVAKTESQEDMLFDRYIHADPEPIISKLDSESALRFHILSSIASGYVHDLNGMFDFLSHTFMHHQKESRNLLNSISQIFEFLHEEKFIEKSGYRFFATALGSLTSRLYIDPMTSITIRDGLHLAKNKQEPLTPESFIHLICCCPDCPLLSGITPKTIDAIEKAAAHLYDQLILNPENHHQFQDVFFYLRTIKTMLMLNEWILETKEDMMCDFFNIGPGDIYRHMDSAQWLMYAATRIAELLQYRSLTFELEKTRQRIRYGIKEELLDLVKLKGIGRVRARILFDHGFHKMSDFKFTTIQALGSIPNISVNLADDLIKQSLTKI